MKPDSNWMRPLFLLAFFLFQSFFGFGQTDSVNKVILEKTTVLSIDTAKIPLVKIPKSRVKDPRKASLLSAVLPGAGQFYNGKYWKIPILWGGAYALGYFINLNHEQYILTRDSYLLQTSGQRDYFNNVYRPDQLVRLREYWRRNRDLLIILSAFGYLLNIADAAVDAHLSGFEVTDDISLRLEPQVQMMAGQPTLGLRMAFTFR
jgi:hypothetical protein